MRNLRRNIGKTLMGGMILGMLLLISGQVYAQISSLDEVNSVLSEQDDAVKDISDTLTNWILIVGAIIAILISLNNKEHSRAAMIGYAAVVIFWLVIKALFF